MGSDWNRRQFLMSAAAQTKPNLLVILSDQQHWRACGFMDPFFTTPNLDALARESTVFEEAFCTTPQCSPSRSSIFTGWYPSRTGVYGNIGVLGGAPLRQETAFAKLQRAGYRTGYFGKWHLGNDPAANAGWSERAIDQADELATDRALTFLKGSGPWAMAVSLLDPHHVYDYRPGRPRGRVTLPKSWHEEVFASKPPIQRQFMTEDQGKFIWDLPQEAWEAYREFYREKVRLFDEQLGRLLRALRESGAAENTVIVVSTDHGEMDTNHRLIFKGPFMYEHMVRIPLVVKAPGVAGRRVRDYQAVNADIAPTLLDYAGVAIPEMQGRSLRLSIERRRVRDRDFVVSEYYSKQNWVNPIRMLRTREFKYNLHARWGEELYDLRTDPHELNNLASTAGSAKRKRQLRAELEHWMAEWRDPFTTFGVTDRAGKPL